MSRETFPNDDHSKYAGPDYRPSEGHEHKAPKGYFRSDERIFEEVCEALTRSPDVDATDMEISVADGVVTLEGTVVDRSSKKMAEYIAEDQLGVSEVINRLRIVKDH